MKKGIIISITVILVLTVILFGCKPLLEKDTEKILTSLCNDTYGEYSDCRAVSVNPCSYNGTPLYRVNYGCTDIPAKYFDSNLKVIADYCWGMPLPDQPESPEICSELDKECQHDINLC